MKKQIGRSDLDSVIDTLGWDIETRHLLRKAVDSFGEAVLDPFIDVYRGYLTSVDRNYKFRKPQHIAAYDDNEDVQPLLSESFLPAPVGGRWAAPADVPVAFGASVEKFAHKFRAPRTLQRRYSSWKKILRLCLDADRCPLPMSVGTAIGIVSHIADSGVSYGEVSAVRDAIVFVHRYRELPLPTEHPRFRRVWAGIVRELGTSNPNRKWALTRDEVGQMIALALKARREDHAVALAVCFEGALRVSELCNQRIEDVHKRGGRARIYVSSSKTDQTGDGEWVELELRARAPFDASAMLIAWMKRLGRREGYLFVDVRSTGLTQEPIDARTFTRMVKSYAAQIGLPPSEISSHSLRAGWITEELTLNRPQAQVAAHVRHASTEMLMRYFRPRRAPHNFVRLAGLGESA
jgi:integrase